MDDRSETAADRFREQIRARALARSGAWVQRTPWGARIGMIVLAVALHLAAAVGLYLLMRPTPTLDQERIAVRLIDAAPSEPELPEPPPAPPQAAVAKSLPPRMARPAIAAPPADAGRAEPRATVETMRLFRADGAVRLPEAPEAPKPTPHAGALERGRELMARGLDCETHGPDDLAHRESAGEEVTRKYLAWIGLYNPAGAMRRAEDEERRQTRCRMWKGTAP